MEKEKNNFMSLEEFLSTTEDDSQTEEMDERVEKEVESMTDEEISKLCDEFGIVFNPELFHKNLAEYKKKKKE